MQTAVHIHENTLLAIKKKLYCVNLISSGNFLYVLNVTHIIYKMPIIHGHVCMCVCIYIYICVYIHTHIHENSGASISLRVVICG
jgi:hypothetical protein